MTMETLEPILAQHPFFEGLEPAYLKLLVGCASNVRFEAGAYIFRRGEEADQFYLLRQGRAALEIFAPQCPPITIATLEKDDVLGWSWVVAPYSWRLDARAVEPTRAIALDGKCLRTKCERKLGIPTVADRIAQQVVKSRLEPAVDPLFHPDSYGYRPGKSALDAVGQARHPAQQWIARFREHRAAGSRVRALRRRL
jgi:CRP/FNR family transcriptional regulator, cyclic AMP receptor protein